MPEIACALDTGMDQASLLVVEAGPVDEAEVRRAQLRERRAVVARDARGPDEPRAARAIGDADAGPRPAGAGRTLAQGIGDRSRQREQPRFEPAVAIEGEGPVEGMPAPARLEGREAGVVLDEGLAQVVRRRDADRKAAGEGEGAGGGVELGGSQDEGVEGDAPAAGLGREARARVSARWNGASSSE
jgi:hypothetical protein